MAPGWMLRSFANRPPAAAARALPSRLPAVIGHLRLSFVLGAGAAFLCYFAAFFERGARDDSLAKAYMNYLDNLWPGPSLVGMGVFALLALSTLWPLLGDRRLARRLRDPRLLPRRLFAPILHWSLSVALTVTAALAVSLCWLFLQCERETATCPFESLTLPIAYQACEGAPPKPRLVVNVLPDGEIRINGLFHTREEMHAVLAYEADRHRMADGWSALSVYVRADADVPVKYVYLISDACRRSRVHRLSFGVSPEDAARTVAPRTE